MPAKNETQQPPVDSISQESDNLAACRIRPVERLRAGMTCPRCRQGQLEYNGLLQLTCSVCGLKEAGACT